jgi:hypothetical protein
MTEPAVTGTMVLRQTVRARNKSPHALSLIAREVGISASMLEDFAAGKIDLNVDALKALTKELYGNAEFDSELDLLRSIAPPATPMGVTPTPYDIDKHSRYHPPPIGPWTRAGGIKSVSPSLQARPLRRPGWVVL